jgi:hypothetical protein
MKIFLTATINTSGIGKMTITDAQARSHQYLNACTFWSKQKKITPILLENSNANIVEITRKINANSPPSSLCGLSFDGQGFDRNLGKGYGEQMTLSRGIAEFPGDENEWIMKCNGRYIISNFSNVRPDVHNQKSDIVGIFRNELSHFDSRFFAARRSFWEKYFLPRGKLISDQPGCWFENILAQAVHAAMADGAKWSLFSAAPHFKGISGTTGRNMDSLFSYKRQQILYAMNRLCQI